MDKVGPLKALEPSPRIRQFAVPPVVGDLPKGKQADFLDQCEQDLPVTDGKSQCGWHRSHSVGKKVVGR